VSTFTLWHVGVAAEAFAVGLFAPVVDVSIQYSANQPEYDFTGGMAGTITK
jgi:hypothetical protein